MKLLKNFSIPGDLGLETDQIVDFVLAHSTRIRYTIARMYDMTVETSDRNRPGKTDRQKQKDDSQTKDNERR